MSRICRKAGFTGFFSNHSLRATAATRLFDKDTDEQLIMLITGHKSTTVRAYKRVSEEKLSYLSDSVACKPTPEKIRVTASSSTSTNDAAASDVECKCTSGAGCVQISVKLDLPGACDHRK